MLFSSAKEKLRKIKKIIIFLSLLVPSLFESYKSKSLRIKLQYTKSICQKSHKIIFTNLTKNYNKSDPKLNFWYKSEEQQNGDYFVIMILMRKIKMNFFLKIWDFRSIFLTTGGDGWARIPTASRTFSDRPISRLSCKLISLFF